MSSWILDEEKLLDINHKYIREPSRYINSFFIYINKNNYIENIIQEQTHFKWDEEQNCGVIPNDILLKLIQDKRHTKNNNVYTYDDSWLYLVDLEPEYIQEYTHSTDETTTQFFNQLKPIDNIIIPPSIFIFHDVNALYFTFRASLNKPKKEFSILKIKGNDDNTNKPHSKTKKHVRITLPTRTKKTRKYLEK